MDKFEVAPQNGKLPVMQGKDVMKCEGWVDGERCSVRQTCIRYTSRPVRPAPGTLFIVPKKSGMECTEYLPGPNSLSADSRISPDDGGHTQPESNYTYHHLPRRAEHWCSNLGASSSSSEKPRSVDVDFTSHEISNIKELLLFLNTKWAKIRLEHGKIPIHSKETDALLGWVYYGPISKQFMFTNREPPSCI